MKNGSFTIHLMLSEKDFGESGTTFSHPKSRSSSKEGHALVGLERDPVL